MSSNELKRLHSKPELRLGAVVDLHSFVLHTSGKQCLKCFRKTVKLL